MTYTGIDYTLTNSLRANITWGDNVAIAPLTTDQENLAMTLADATEKNKLLMQWRIIRAHVFDYDVAGTNPISTTIRKWLHVYAKVHYSVWSDILRIHSTGRDLYRLG